MCTQPYNEDVLFNSTEFRIVLVLRVHHKLGKQLIEISIVNHRKLNIDSQIILMASVNISNK